MPSQSLLLLVATIAVAVTISQAAPAVVIEASRVIQFDRIVDAKSNTELGTRSALVRGKLQLASTDADIATLTSQLTSSVVLVTGKAKATAAFVEAIAALQPQAIVFFSSTLGLEASRALTQRSFGVAMYAISEDNSNSTMLLDSIVPTVQGSKFDELFVSLGDAKVDAPTVVPAPEAVAVIAQLEPKAAKKSNKDSTEEKKKKIHRMLLSSQFDAVGVTPLTTFGDLSATAAVCEIHRLVGNSTGNKNAPFALHTLVSNHGRFNYLGTRKWIASQQALLVDTYDLAVSIDTLLSEENALYIHSVARLDDDENNVMSSFLRFLKEEAVKREVTLRFVSKKTNATHYDVRFEHEVFAHKKLTAVTISTVEDHSQDQLTRLASPSAVFISADKVKRATVFTEMIAAAVARFLQASVVDLRAIPAEVENMISFGASKPGALSPYSAMGQGAVTSLVERRLRIRREDLTMSSATAVKKFPLTEIPSLQVFGPFGGLLKVYVSKVTSFELGITAAVGLYVITLAVGLFGFDRAMLLLSGVKMNS